MCELKISSLNVRGLNQRAKRDQVYTLFRDQGTDIILLQETYSEDFSESVGVLIPQKVRSAMLKAFYFI